MSLLICQFNLCHRGTFSVIIRIAHPEMPAFNCPDFPAGVAGSKLDNMGGPSLPVVRIVEGDPPPDKGIIFGANTSVCGEQPGAVAVKADALDDQFCLFHVVTVGGDFHLFVRRYHKPCDGAITINELDPVLGVGQLMEFICFHVIVEQVKLSLRPGPDREQHSSRDQRHDLDRHQGAGLDPIAVFQEHAVAD